MKKTLIIVILSFAVFFSLFLSAGSDEGKEVFAAKCGKCHRAGGEAPSFTAKKYAKAQWKRFFSREVHQTKKDISGIISNDEMETILGYLVRNAADAATPEAAGLKK